MSLAIQVKNLSKTFSFAVKDSTRGAWKNFFTPVKKIVQAVDSVSFNVERGEALAFIGPNGAGKSTCIKMLTGILYPTEGSISVLGLDPQQQRQQLSYKIGTVFGQRSQLVFNLPVHDSFQLFGKIYELSDHQIAKRERELVKLFQIEDIIDQPVRKLSLGQRMRCEIAVSLIHDPSIIFLDEPTIGLDIVAKRALREVLKRLNKDRGTTIFLTSHDVGDIEALCERTIVINHGRIVLDQPTDALRHTYLTQKHVKVTFTEEQTRVRLPGAKLLKQEGRAFQFSIDARKHALNDVLRDIMAISPIEDIDVESTSLEEIIGTIYGRKTMR